MKIKNIWNHHLDHYRRGLKNWEEKDKPSIQFNNSNTFFCKGWWKNTLLRDTWKPQTPKKSNCQKGFVSPDPFRLYKDSWMIPSEMPPSKVTEKWAHLIGDSIPYPTEEILLTRNKKKTSCPVSSISSSPWRSIPPEDPERFRKKLLTIAKVQKPQSHIKWVPRHWVTPHQQHCPTSFRDRSPCAARLQAASAECGRNAGCFGDLGQSQYEPVFSSEKLSFFSGVWN